MQIREHKELLCDSMGTVCQIASTRLALFEFIKEQFVHFPAFNLRAEAIKVEPYGFDARINWNTYIVTIDGYGVFGFTDGPLEE